MDIVQPSKLCIEGGQLHSPDGSIGIRPGRLKAEDQVDLRAEINELTVLSNCPEAPNATTGENGPTPIRAIVYEKSYSAADPKVSAALTALI